MEPEKLLSEAEEVRLNDINPSGSSLPKVTWKEIVVHSALFILTFISCAYSGIFLVGQTAVSTDLADLFTDGAVYAALLLAFLATHEFGHYFAARFHKVEASLPWFIPMPFIFIGTLGAVIRMKSFIARSLTLFDVGIAGPIAGFVTSIVILLYGFSTMPGPEFLYAFDGHDNLHAYIAQHGTFPADPLPESEGSEALVLGNTVLFSVIASFFEGVPPMSELYHYPWLFAGWLGLFFTALNLMPIGQLDGGHIMYAMFGPRIHFVVARVFLVLISSLAGTGFIPVLGQQLAGLGITNLATTYFVWLMLLFFLFNRGFKGDHRWTAPALVVSIALTFVLTFFISGTGKTTGTLMWLMWMFLAVFFIRLEHPPVFINDPITGYRRVLGWISILIFVACISPYPIYTT